MMPPLPADYPRCAECRARAEAHVYVPEHQDYACPGSSVLALTFYRAPA
jgi:hypothetical protein